MIKYYFYFVVNNILLYFYFYSHSIFSNALYFWCMIVSKRNAIISSESLPFDYFIRQEVFIKSVSLPSIIFWINELLTWYFAATGVFFSSFDPWFELPFFSRFTSSFEGVESLLLHGSSNLICFVGCLLVR